MPYASTYDDLTADPMATRSRRVGVPPPAQPTLSKLGQLLERERATRANAPLEVSPIPEGLLDASPAMRQPQPIPYPGVQSPEEMERTSRGYKTFGHTPGAGPTDRLALLEEAPLGSKVERGVSGNFEVGAPKKPSRLMKALEGALSAAAMAGASGPTEGTAGRMLGGAAVGGIGGGVKPRLVEKFQRENELAQLRGEIGEDQGIAYKDAQIAGAKAQPELRELQVKNTINESLLREQDRRADNRRADTAIGETKRATDERIRHNKELEKKPGARPTRTLNGQIWEKDDDGVWKVGKGSPPPTPPKPAASTAAADERRAVRSEKKAAAGREAAALYKKGSDYWDQAQAKRKEAETLSAKKFQTDAEKATIARLNREAEGLEAKTREVQIKGDGLAAESEGTDEAPQSTGGTRKSFNLGAWKRDHPAATPAEVEAKRQQYSAYRIVE